MCEQSGVNLQTIDTISAKEASIDIIGFDKKDEKGKLHIAAIAMI